MKALTLALLITLPCLGYPQGVFTNHTHSTLQQVLNDYQNSFRNIRGNAVSNDPQTTYYTSKVEIHGAVNTIITQYSAAEGMEIYSWKCTVLESDDFEAASKKYLETFEHLKNSIIKIDGQKPFILNGSFNTPTEEKRFNSSLLKLLPASAGRLNSVCVELTMEFLVTDWKISILVYDKKEEELVMD